MQINKQIDFDVKWYDSVTSTNDLCVHAAADGVAEGLVIAANFQEQGRGQRGNSWESNSGLNLTFSILLRPVFLNVEAQFLISKVAAVAVCDWIDAYLKGKNAAIKWPNDIYVGNSKVAGILIENSFRSSLLDVSVVGIGININQDYFSSDLPNPTSLLLETKRVYGLPQSLLEFLSCFKERYLQAQSENIDMVDADYLNRLYRKDLFCTYRAGGDEFKARIVGVRPTGELMLQTEDGYSRSFAFKEVTFVI